MTRKPHPRPIPAVALALCLAALSALAAIGSVTQLKIDFTNPHDAESKAVWSDTNQFNITANGFGRDGEAASNRAGWIQTKPIGVGLVWRPTAGVGLRVRIDPPPRPIKLNSGQIYTPYFGRVFARYSPDAKHWSSWHELRQDGTNQPSIHTGSMAVPRRDQERLQTFRQEYSKLDVPWPDNAEAFVEWLLKREPDFFAGTLPFIGYVEFLVEGNFYGGQRIQRLEADIFWNVSGMHQPPKDKTIKMDMDAPWRYKAR